MTLVQGLLNASNPLIMTVAHLSRSLAWASGSNAGLSAPVSQPCMERVCMAVEHALLEQLQSHVVEAQAHAAKPLLGLTGAPSTSPSICTAGPGLDSRPCTHIPAACTSRLMMALQAHLQSDWAQRHVAELGLDQEGSLGCNQQTEPAAEFQLHHDGGRITAAAQKAAEFTVQLADSLGLLPPSRKKQVLGQPGTGPKVRTLANVALVYTSIITAVASWSM